MMTAPMARTSRSNPALAIFAAFAGYATHSFDVSYADWPPNSLRRDIYLHEYTNWDIYDERLHRPFRGIKTQEWSYAFRCWKKTHANSMTPQLVLYTLEHGLRETCGVLWQRLRVLPSWYQQIWITIWRWRIDLKHTRTNQSNHSTAFLCGFYLFSFLVCPISSE